MKAALLGLVGLGCCWALILKRFSSQILSELIQDLEIKNTNWESGMEALGDEGPTL